ncbi:response regulator [Planctomicrobium sp.]|jgi:DNA-binding response OmpR family regulator|nr:response regulator [Planctomicrobium sp.]MDA7504215.1 response regulator [bacterium]MDB4439573.1 response regulator [Planctomicrobium sp.]
METALQTCRVLVVDDSPTSLSYVSKILEESGFEVMQTQDGESAIEIAENEKLNVLLLDIILPKKNGFQVCRELKSNALTSDLKIILLSSKSQETDRFWGQRQGADAYLTKPVDPGELVSIVRAVARGS